MLVIHRKGSTLFIEHCLRLQARALQGPEVHRQRLTSTFEALEGRILEGKTESAAACKPLSMQEKVHQPADEARISSATVCSHHGM